MQSKFILKVEGQADLNLTSKDRLISTLDNISPYLFVILESGDFFIQMVLDSDVFFDSVVEMNGYTASTPQYYRKVGLTFLEIKEMFQLFYDTNELPSEIGWENITIEIQNNE